MVSFSSLMILSMSTSLSWRSSEDDSILRLVLWSPPNSLPSNMAPSWWAALPAFKKLKLIKPFLENFHCVGLFWHHHYPQIRGCYFVFRGVYTPPICSTFCIIDKVKERPQTGKFLREARNIFYYNPLNFTRKVDTTLNSDSLSGYMY